MGVTADYRRQILELTEELPKDKVKELINFGQFLRTKRNSFFYSHIENSAAYVEKIRREEGKKFKSGKKFIEELIKWQRLNS